MLSAGIEPASPPSEGDILSVKLRELFEEFPPAGRQGTSITAFGGLCIIRYAPWTHPSTSSRLLYNEDIGLVKRGEREYKNQKVREKIFGAGRFKYLF